MGMKTLADVKRRAQLGVKLKCTFAAYDPAGTMTGSVREISIVQTKMIALKRADGRDSWLQWPSAKEVTVEGDSFTVYEAGEKLLTYEFVQ
jgi:hypothetical protein